MYSKQCLTFWLAMGLLMSNLGFAVEADKAGMVHVKSAHTVAKTIDRLETILSEKGMKIFRRVNHAKGAKGASISLRPTQLLIFGNPKVGAPLMACQQTVALDLPQKALAWEDAGGQVWLSYNAPDYLQQRHQISGCKKVLNKVSKALAKFADYATRKGP